MKTLNLVYPEKSDIKYRIDRFPDGQQQVNILDIGLGGNFYDLSDILHDEQITKVQIKSRLNNFQDLELIICATKSLRSLGVKEIRLYTPYFLGSRSDRQFEEGSNNYLRDVICPIINSLKFESVTVMDPHSDVLEACLNNFKKISNLDLVKFAIDDLEVNSNMKAGKYFNNFILVSPDAGAGKKIYKVAEQIGYKRDIITCSKSRDEQGKLTRTKVPTVNYEGKDLLIIDDICDGGATFINIAKEFKKIPGFNSKIYLIVTHSIFSKGTTELGHYFDAIYTTNSYKNCNQLELMKVKQLNVF